MSAIIIGPFPCPMPARGQERVGPKQSQAHWSQRSKVVAEQRAIVAAVFRGTCWRCGALPTAVKGRLGWMVKETCSCRRPLRPHQLPPHGPEHPVDVLIVRIGRAGAPHEGLDDDGAITSAKAHRDEIAEQLWPKDDHGKPIGKVDDSVSWLRFLVRQRPHRKTKNPRKARELACWVPGPPDPPNKGTELCEIVIASRYCCPYCGDEPAIVRGWREG